MQTVSTGRPHMVVLNPVHELKYTRSGSYRRLIEGLVAGTAHATVDECDAAVAACVQHRRK